VALWASNEDTVPAFAPAVAVLGWIVGLVEVLGEGCTEEEERSPAGDLTLRAHSSRRVGDEHT